MTARRAGISAVALTTLAVAVMLLMVMFAARSGPDRIFAGPLHDPHVRAVNPTYSPPALPRGTGGRGSGLINSNPVLRAIGTLIRIALGVCVVWLLYRGARRLAEWLRSLMRRRRRRNGPTQVEFDVLDDAERLAEEMRRDADDQFDLLLTGLPRNAIVACWDRFEDTAERVHIARHEWETSSEFILRLLGAVSADSDGVSRLEGLYREARFSTHDIDEARRQAAVSALRDIHSSLGVTSGRR